MELHQLRIFVVVAEEKSITRAARRLYITPSTISEHIKTLENELGVQLFTRTRQGMLITAKGEALREKAQAALQAAQAFVNHAADMQQGMTGTVHLGLCSDPVFLQIPTLIEQLRCESPGISLRLEKSSTPDIIQAVAAGQLDAGFVFGDVPSAVFLRQIELVVAAPVDWEACADWDALAALPWISVGQDCPFHAVLGRTPENVVTLNDDRSRYDLVAAGIGLSLLERDIAQQGVRAGLLRIMPVEPLSCPLSLIHNDSLLTTQVVARIINQATHAAS